MVELLKNIISRYPQINAAYLYGSAAANRLRHNSDLDVALLLAEPYTADELAAVHAQIISEVEAAFQREADVKILNELEHLPLVQNIIAGGRLFYDRQPAQRKAFAVKKNLEYLDFLPHYERMLNIYAERLRNRGATKSHPDRDHADSSEYRPHSDARAIELG